MAECYNVACQYCVGYQCRRTCTCDIRLEAGEYVKVVRCKDCKYLITDAYKQTMCWRTSAWVAMSPDDYCSYGVRKDGADNE